MTKFFGNQSKDAHKCPELVSKYLQSYGIPIPQFEYRFCPTRKWRMDLCWPDYKVYLEIQGGIWLPKARHTNGAALLKEWEKLNTATTLGWKPLFCQPADFFTDQTMDYIRKALGLIGK